MLSCNLYGKEGKMKKIPLTIVCIAALSLLCILPQANAQDTQTGLFGDPSTGTQNVTPLFQPRESHATQGLTWAVGRVGSRLTDPSSGSIGTDYGIFNPSLARINAMLSGPGDPPDEPPAQPPDPPSNFFDPSTRWNPFPIGGIGSQNPWFENVNSAFSEP